MTDSWLTDFITLQIYLSPVIKFKNLQNIPI